MPHPLRALLPKEKTVRIEASSVLSGKVDSGFFRIGDCEVLAPPPLSLERSERPPSRTAKKISPSTLNKVLDCPAQWYFKEVRHLDSAETNFPVEP